MSLFLQLIFVFVRVKCNILLHYWYYFRSFFLCLSFFSYFRFTQFSFSNGLKLFNTVSRWKRLFLLHSHVSRFLYPLRNHLLILLSTLLMLHSGDHSPKYYAWRMYHCLLYLFIPRFSNYIVFVFFFYSTFIIPSSKKKERKKERSCNACMRAKIFMKKQEWRKVKKLR